MKAILNDPDSVDIRSKDRPPLLLELTLGYHYYS